MRIVSWNVNSINARLERFEAYVRKDLPDILCLQELKCETPKYPYKTTESLGYHSLVRGQKTYNGIAILSKNKSELISDKLNDPRFDDEARFMHALVEGVHILNAYVVNGQEVGAERYLFKLQWMQRLTAYIAEIMQTDTKLVLVGDFNIARSPDDVYNHDQLDGGILYSKPERQALEALIATGLTDTFRLHTPTGKHFSWWDYRNLGFPMGKGLRIDYVFASPAMAAVCNKAWINREERKGQKPSDHAPVGAEFLLD